ncbi:MAG: Gfo/Idh/MocA family oxidoreductase, partial [Gemmatimonadota bacterium]|nr:Gfo/Idh/MocA family oxidoreductase [Gemmatimonadota bacterium]
MFKKKQNRRSFIINSSAATLMPLIGNSMPAQASESSKPLRVGVIGVGGRGIQLLRMALMVENIEIPAICDIDESKTARAQRLVERRGHPKPDGYSNGPEDYKRMHDRDDLDAVICATPWKWHTPMMVDAMNKGKYAGVEVPAGENLDELWQLVETSEKTGVPCMMLENYGYFRSVMMIINLVETGRFGELVHSEVGFQKDQLASGIGPDGSLTGYAQLRTTRNGNLYPTHAVGPAGWAMDINRGDLFSYLVSMSSRSKHLHDFTVEKFGPDHPASQVEFKNGDVNTTLIRTKQGRTLTVYYDVQSPRPWDPITRFQGSKGIFLGSMNKIYVDGISPQLLTWDDADSYYEKYDHPLWKKYGNLDVSEGRG